MTMSPLLILRLVLLLLLPLSLIQSVVSTFPPQKNHRLSSYRHDQAAASTAVVSNHDLKTKYYNQTLDHFNYAPSSYVTFRQRYVINSKHWGGSAISSPIFAYLGAEGSLDDDLRDGRFFLDDITANHFQSLSVYIEHRFYGESIPFGSLEKAIENNITRGYFNSAQALADYAEILLHIKEELSAQNSPIIVFGGSYGGMLASWLRLKYPHVALGALASSAPILYFDDSSPQNQNGYFPVLSQIFKDLSVNCYKTIRESWAEIEKVASKHDGLLDLTQRFKACSHLKGTDGLTSYLISVYSSAAQYNGPPQNKLFRLCEAIDKAPTAAKSNNNILDRIFAGTVAAYSGTFVCNDIKEEPEKGADPWYWQTCSEMVMFLKHAEGDTMFGLNVFNLTKSMRECEDSFGVQPRPHWITTHYGGHDMKLILKRFGSNIIFSNGLKDPFIGGGVLHNLSDTMVAVTTPNGTHTMDLMSAEKTDPEWLTEQRKTEVKIIEGWLKTYYCDLALDSLRF